MPGGERGLVVNKYIMDQASARNIKIAVLSEYEAELYGTPADLQWFTQNYPAMLCAFDPRQNLSNRETYISCTSHAPQWIEIIRSQHPEYLMLRQTKFLENCSSLP